LPKKINLTGHMGYVRHTDLLESVRGGVGITKQAADRLIVLFLFESFSLTDVAAITDVLCATNRILERRNEWRNRYMVRLMSSRGGVLASTSGIRVWTDGLDARHFGGAIDSVIIADGPGAHPASQDCGLLAWLRKIGPEARTVCAVGDGAMILEAAGIPAWPDQSVRRIRASSKPEAISACVSDCHRANDGLFTALSLVSRDHGLETARDVAEVLMPRCARRVIEWTGHPMAAVSDTIRAAARRLQSNCERAISIADAARASAMSERNFLRRFKLEMGITPSEFLLRCRLERACELLVRSDLPVDKVARRTGLGSGVRLATLFRKRMFASPTAYRNAARRRMNNA
jgi:transcriptional regulator GlxA family with amidase domain